MKRPSNLYKYCTAKVAKIVLQTGRLRASSPVLFNDPFDSYFAPRFSNLPSSLGQLRKRSGEILSGTEVLPPGSAAAFNYAPLVSLSTSVPKEVAARTLASTTAWYRSVAEQFGRDSRDEWDKILVRFRVLCLCESGNNPLLWSHYAQGHQGAALEFRASDYRPFNEARAVTYRRTPPKTFSAKDFVESALGLRDLPEPRFIPLVMTKASEWSYEKEWRWLGSVKNAETRRYEDCKFPPASLSKILLGCHISIRDRKAIEHLTKGDFGHVEIHQAHQSETRYGLEFERIK